MIHIGPGTLTSGRLASADAVLLDGRLEGSICCPRLHVGANGYLVGNAEVEELIVDGQIVGDISARSVTLNATAVVEGDVRHQTLSKHPSAVLVGRSRHAEDWQPPEAAEALRRRQSAIAEEVDEILRDSMRRQSVSARRWSSSYGELPAREVT